MANIDTDGLVNTDTDGLVNTDTDGLANTDTDGLVNTDTDGLVSQYQQNLALFLRSVSWNESADARVEQILNKKAVGMRNNSRENVREAAATEGDDEEKENPYSDEPLLPPSVSHNKTVAPHPSTILVIDAELQREILKPLWKSGSADARPPPSCLAEEWLLFTLEERRLLHQYTLLHTRPPPTPPQLVFREEEESAGSASGASCMSAQRLRDLKRRRQAYRSTATAGKTLTQVTREMIDGIMELIMDDRTAPHHDGTDREAENNPGHDSNAGKSSSERPPRGYHDNKHWESKAAAGSLGEQRSNRECDTSQSRKREPFSNRKRDAHDFEYGDRYSDSEYRSGNYSSRNNEKEYSDRYEKDGKYLGSHSKRSKNDDDCGSDTSSRYYKRNYNNNTYSRARRSNDGNDRYKDVEDYEKHDEKSKSSRERSASNRSDISRCHRGGEDSSNSEQKSKYFDEESASSSVPDNRGDSTSVVHDDMSDGTSVANDNKDYYGNGSGKRKSSRYLNESKRYQLDNEKLDSSKIVYESKQNLITANEEKVGTRPIEADDGDDTDDEVSKRKSKKNHKEKHKKHSKEKRHKHRKDSKRKD